MVERDRLPDGCIECFLGRTKVITRPRPIRIIYSKSYDHDQPDVHLSETPTKLTFIRELGKSALATRDLRPGSRRRQCNDEVLIARSFCTRSSMV